MAIGTPATSQPAHCNITDCTQASLKDIVSVDTVTNNGGFIAAAAGLSIVVPIICVLIVQLRRAKKAERARLRAAPVAIDVEADDPRIIDLPPPYEEMFGSNSFTTVGDAGQSINFEILVDENEAVQQRNRYTNYQTENGLANVFRAQSPPGVTTTRDDVCDGQTCAWNVRTYSNNTDSLIATISGSAHMADIASDCNAPQTSNTGSQGTSLQNTLPLGTYSDLSTVPPLPDQAHFFVIPSLEDRINSEHIHANIVSQVPPRRYPGMHILFEDFSPGGYQDNQADSPPPSYEEALHILEKIELAKDHMY